MITMMTIMFRGLSPLASLDSHCPNFIGSHKHTTHLYDAMEMIMIKIILAISLLILWPLSILMRGKEILNHAKTLIEIDGVKNDQSKSNLSFQTRGLSSHDHQSWACIESDGSSSSRSYIHCILYSYVLVHIRLFLQSHTCTLIPHIYHFFLHWQNFWRIKFTPKNANFLR